MKVKENDTIKCESLLIIYDSSVEDDDNFRTYFAFALLHSSGYSFYNTASL